MFLLLCHGFFFWLFMFSFFFVALLLYNHHLQCSSTRFNSIDIDVYVYPSLTCTPSTSPHKLNENSMLLFKLNIFSCLLVVFCATFALYRLGYARICVLLILLLCSFIVLCPWSKNATNSATKHEWINENREQTCHSCVP